MVIRVPTQQEVSEYNPNLDGWDACSVCQAPVPPGIERCWDHGPCPLCKGRGSLRTVREHLCGATEYREEVCPDCGGTRVES